MVLLSPTVIIFLSSIFIRIHSLISSDEDSVDVNQWLNLSRNSPRVSPDRSSSEHSVTNSQLPTLGSNNDNNDSNLRKEEIPTKHKKYIRSEASKQRNAIRQRQQRQKKRELVSSLDKKREIYRIC